MRYLVVRPVFAGKDQARWCEGLRHGLLALVVGLSACAGRAEPVASEPDPAIADTELRSSHTAGQVVVKAGFDQPTIKQGEVLARGVVESFVGKPCEPDTRWLLYFHSPACPACKPAVKRLAALLDEGDDRLRVITVAIEGDSSPLGDRANVETTDLSPALESWFVHARGGLVTPYFMGLRCGEPPDLRLVGFGRFDDATTWDELATETTE